MTDLTQTLLKHLADQRATDPAAAARTARRLVGAGLLTEAQVLSPADVDALLIQRRALRAVFECDARLTAQQKLYCCKRIGAMRDDELAGLGEALDRMAVNAVVQSIALAHAFVDRPNSAQAPVYEGRDVADHNRGDFLREAERYPFPTDAARDKVARALREASAGEACALGFVCNLYGVDEVFRRLMASPPVEPVLCR